MKDSVYLVMNSKGVRHMYKTRPRLKSGEYAVKVKVSVPDEFFNRAIPEATLEIPDGYMIEPPVDMEVEEPPVPEEEEEDYEWVDRGGEL